jgi:hypothetical protein
MVRESTEKMISAGSSPEIICASGITFLRVLDQDAYPVISVHKNKSLLTFTLNNKTLLKGETFLHNCQVVLSF